MPRQRRITVTAYQINRAASYRLDFVASACARVVRAVGKVGSRGASARPPSRPAVRSSPHEARGAKPAPSSNGSSTNAANGPTRSNTGATITTPSSRPPRCPRTLDHGQSLGSLDQASAHRIERDIADSGEQVLLIHRHRAEPRLPEISGPAVARMDVSGGAPVQIAERPP